MVRQELQKGFLKNEDRETRRREDEETGCAII
jgi:hypothetical protein